MKLAFRSLVASLALVLSASFAAAAPSNWTIDGVHTDVSFEVKHMFSKVRGVFREFSGTIVFDAENASKISVDASVNAASVDTGNEKRDGHLRSADFFETEKFPTITFKSKKVEAAGKNKYKVTGDFTMHGVTKSVVFDAEFLGANEKKGGFSARTTINRKDYGIVWNRALDTGGFVLGDDVDIVLNLQVNKAQ